MKTRYLKNILFIMLIFVITILMFNSNVQAFKMDLSTSSQKINKGDTFSVTLKSDETFVTCDFQIKYDSDIFEYVDETQTNWSIKDYPSEGYLIAVYADISGKGTNNITIKFKAKKTTTNANISLQNENFTNTEGVSYNEETVTKNPVTIKVEENTTKPSEEVGGSTTKPSEEVGESTTTSNDGKQNSSTQSSTPSTTITSTTSGQKTNGILPKTGKGTNIILVAIVILIIISILLKNKIKFWKGIGMFILAFTITTAVLSTSTYAYDVMPKYGKFDNLMSDKKIFAVCLDKNDKSGELKANQIPNLISDVLSLKDKNGKEISNDSTIGTGSKILLSDNIEYTLLLYGDVNGDGKINSGDIYPIIQHILKNTTLTDIYAKAANLSNKNDSNDAQINSTDIYPIIKFILRDLSTDLVVEFPTNGSNSGDVEEEKLSINVSYSTTTTTTGTVTVKITANKELNSLNGWILSTDKKSLTKEYEQNVQESVTVTDINGETATVDIKISNIQKPVEDLVLSTTYSDTDWISGDVTATIKANKQIVAPNGWELSSDKKSITKEYLSNIEENVSVTDIDGITKTSKISISNIDKVMPSTNGLYVLDNYLGKQDRNITIPIDLQVGYDGESGLESTQYTITKDSTIIAQETITNNKLYNLEIAEPGHTYLITIKNTDKAWNMTESNIVLSVQDYLSSEAGQQENADNDANYDVVSEAYEKQLSELKSDKDFNADYYAKTIQELTRQKELKLSSCESQRQDEITAAQIEAMGNAQLTAILPVTIATINAKFDQRIDEINAEYEADVKTSEQNYLKMQNDKDSEIASVNEEYANVKKMYQDMYNVLTKKIWIECTSLDY